MSATQSLSAKRIPELDGLRGIAISLVIILHYFTAALTVYRPHPLAYLQIATRLSWSGVDLFFVLSGFLIGGILLDARGSANYFKVFYLRRFCRIFPIFFVFLALIGLCYWFIYPFHRFLMDWLFAAPMPWYSYPTFTQNFWMAKWNYLGPASLSITWSLAVEEQFYLTLPALIRFVRSSLLPYVLGAGILSAPLLRIALIIWRPQAQTALYVLLPCRMDALLLGVFAAYLFRKPGFAQSMYAHRKLLWSLFAILAAGLVYFTSTSGNTSVPMASIGYDWLALFYLTALVLALVHTQSWLARMLRWRWLMSLGTIAYGAYLFHYVIYGLCMAYLRGEGSVLGNFPDVAVTLFALALTIFFTALSWRFFEKRVVRWGHKYSY
ncbi:MAG TPA: acyltransferase [Candidatus Acidoferrum sp.]|nr:acyltransferase [Candidatus Acidoferrum sp.]